jgi:DNA-directed RNA polymerase subunit RPC12/RpoP
MHITYLNTKIIQSEISSLPPHFTSETQMNNSCPNCNSSRITTKNIGRKSGGFIGSIGGAVSGATGALSGAELGATLGVTGGPIGIAIGGIAGALIGGLFGGVAGGIAGATVGEQVDTRILNNYQCLSCGHSFTSKNL